MGSIMQKIMGPLMTAAGIGAAFIPGGQAAAPGLITGGLEQMSSQGGVLGPNPSAVPPSSPVSSVAPTPGVPAMPETSTPAGQGFALTVPGAGPTGASSADTMSQGIAANMMANNPFAAYA